MNAAPVFLSTINALMFLKKWLGVGVSLPTHYRQMLEKIMNKLYLNESRRW